MTPCNHGRRTTRCIDCARETFIGGSDPADSIARTLEVELACRDNYIAWLENRVREMDDIREAVSA